MGSIKLPYGIYILQVECETGIVLDVHGTYFSNITKQPKFVFFSNLKQAYLKAQEIIDNNPLIDAVVFENGQLIKTFSNPTAIELIKQKRNKYRKKWWQFWK